MTKKELYFLSVKVSQAALRAWFGDEIGFKNMESTRNNKNARKAAYEALTHLLDKE